MSASPLLRRTVPELGELVVEPGERLGITGLDRERGRELLEEIVGGRGAVRMAWVPRTRLDRAPFTAREVVVYALVPGLRWTGWIGRRDWERGTALLEAMGLGDLAARPMRDLPEEARRRVLLARARILDPALLVLEDPIPAGADRSATEWWVERLTEPGGPAAILTGADDAALEGVATRILRVREPR